MVIRIRTYGSSGALTILIHGGPGAAGYLAPVANGLKDLFLVIVPFQRRSGARPLSVASHVADLHEIVISQCGGERPAVIGHSWGAMLALAYAGAHPEAAGPLVLIGCGTFDVTARGYMEATIEERTDDQLRLRLERLPEEISDPDERVREMGRLIQP